MLDETDHGVRLGHAVADRVWRYDDAGYADDTAAVASLQQATSVAVGHSRWMFCQRKECWLMVWSCHVSTMADRRGEKSGQVWVRGREGLRGGILDGDGGSYVRRSDFTSFAISPDGAEVAYLRFETTGRWSILEVIPQRGGESRELFRDNNNTGSTMRTSFWKVPVAGGAAEEMGISAPGEIRLPSLHPKGGRIAFSGTGGGSQPAIWMIENFLPRTR